MKASDLLVKCLENEGIEYIFGIPGEENADFMMSLEKSDSIKFILTRHEQGAAFMAEIYGRLTGHPAACLATLGPGATNLITGVADANMDRAPMLVLIGQGSTERLHKESHQIINAIEMFKPVTKWATTIINPSSIPEITRKALRLARSEKPGAVLIELPEDVAKLNSDELPIKPRRFRRAIVNDCDIERIAARIKQAKRPVIIAGNGCVRNRSSHELSQFCELTGIGVLNTFMAKGCVDYIKPYSLFTIGLGAKDIVTCVVDNADLVITIGFDMVEYHPNIWNPNGDKDIVHIDFIPAEIDKCYHPEIEGVGDVANALARLSAHFEKDDFEFDLQQQQRVRVEMLKELTAWQNNKSKEKVKPQKILSDVRELLPPEGILLSDVGAHKMWIARQFQCHLPNTCLIPNGFCSMGFALPGAIAAALVHPDRPIIGIAGDGGFLMNVQEMETAKRINSDITMIVWEDNAYGLIAWKQWAEFGDHTELSFGNPKWRSLADAFGWSYHFAKDSSEVKTELTKPLLERGPSLMVIPVDYAENQKLTEKFGQLTCTL